jgi:MFS family permease
MACVGLTIGSSGPIISSLWAEAYGTKHLGAIRSFVTALNVTSTSISPVLFGVIIDKGMSINQLFQSMGIFTICSVVLICFSYRPDRQQNDFAHC